MFLRLLQAPRLGLADQMALDETLLDAAPPAPCLRLYRWTPASVPSATFGYAQRHADVLQTLPPHLRRRCTRRPTGGGIVIHDIDLTFSLVAPRALLPAAPADLYLALHNAIAAALSSALALPLRLVPPSPAEPMPLRPCQSVVTDVAPASQCFLAPVPADLLAPDGHKVLGGALRRRATHVLYQGSLRLEGARTCLHDACADALLSALLALFHLSAALPLTAPPPVPALLARYASPAWIARR